MTNELAKIDPKEFGLEQKEAATIEQAFLPKIAERDALLEMYESMLKAEITPAVCKQAKELRLKLVKVRTGISEIHKTQKAFFLAAGRFVDAWKNKETTPIEQMEENLTDIEKYFERLEAEKVAKLAAEREAEIRKYSDVIPYDLGRMDLSVYTNYLTGLKVAQEARLKAEKEAEQKRAEDERIDKLGRERISEIYKYAQFQDELVSVISMGTMSNEQYAAFHNLLEAKKVAYEAEQEKIRLENERLKADAEKREQEIAAERKKQAEILLKAEAEADRKLKEQAEITRKEQEKADAERALLQAELQAKKDAEEFSKAEFARIEAARIAAEETAAKAPRKEKLTVWVDGFAIPEFANDDVAADISAKFMAFKGWAKGLVEKL